MLNTSTIIMGVFRAVVGGCNLICMCHEGTYVLKNIFIVYAVSLLISFLWSQWFAALNWPLGTLPYNVHLLVIGYLIGSPSWDPANATCSAIGLRMDLVCPLYCLSAFLS